MRKLIRNWLLRDPGIHGASVDRSHHIPHVEGATVFINRISNGYLVQHEGRCTYCKDAEEISGHVVALFARSTLGEKQLDLFDAKQNAAQNSGIIGTHVIHNRPLNQSY